MDGKAAKELPHSKNRALLISTFETGSHDFFSKTRHLNLNYA
jgi:hypothetical protein